MNKYHDIIFDVLGNLIKQCNLIYKFTNEEKSKLLKEKDQYDTKTFENTKKLLTSYNQIFSELTLSGIGIQNKIIQNKIK